MSVNQTVQRLLLVCSIISLSAINSIAQKASGNDSILNELVKDVSFLKKIKLSGYVHAQFQHADTAGIKSFAGGDFPAASNNRFSVRRGRLKVAYEGENSQYVFQIDATERGVSIKDAYLKFSEPWTKWLSLTAGVFVRPFGYELTYSSSQRESPERTRMLQTLFPGERDIGGMLSIQPPSKYKAHLLKLDAGVLNGAGLNLEFDGHKDFFARLSATESSSEKKLNYRAGVSYYLGGVRQTNDTLYKMNGNCFATEIDSSEGNHISDRMYLGADAEVSHKFKFGTTLLRGEVIQGTQSGTSSSNTSFTKAPDKFVYERKFIGAYVYLVQGFFKDKHQLAVKYDFLDPNMDVKGSEMQPNCKLGSTDLLYHTIGFGYIWNVNKNLKFVAYYDLVKNETASNIGIAKDLKDNVFTLRAQVKL